MSAAGYCCNCNHNHSTFMEVGEYPYVCKRCVAAPATINVLESTYNLVSLYNDGVLSAEVFVQVVGYLCVLHRPATASLPASTEFLH